MNSTTYAKRVQYKPIDIFFRGVVDIKSKVKKVVFVDAFQILNDRYLGRLNVCNYFAVAENSVRINELNIIALEELKNYHLVMKENFLIPDNTVYGLPISTRFLENEQDFEILLSTLKDNNYKKGSIVLSFYGTSLVRIDGEAKKRYNRLRRAGYKTAVAQFGEDFNSIDIFAGVTFDYIRCEAQFFDSSQGKKKLLSMLLRFCNSNKITMIMEGVDTPGQLARFRREGVKLATGRAVSKLSRWVTNEFLFLPEPVGEKRDAYLLKLKKELDAKERAELAELTALRNTAIEKAKAADENGVMPVSARPELAKSPYQVRLEQQRLAAKRLAEVRLVAQQADLSAEDLRSIAEQTRLHFTGDLQSALSLSFNFEKSRGAEAAEGSDRKDKDATAETDVRTDKDGRAYLDMNESGVFAPVRPEAPAEGGKSKPQNRKSVRADIEKHNKLLEEYRSDGLFGELGMTSGIKGLNMSKPKGIGVTLKIAGEEKDAPSLIGSYNEKGQWVDEEGNVYNGYFDLEGKWIEYEQFDSEQEGHYNERGQWVDKDGKVYDGYFDEEGRWIDYTYTAPDGEIIDNGYFDDKLGKWVPFGYFADDGSYHRF